MVTILILIDGFLQYCTYKDNDTHKISHNPYFNRWFSAIYLNGHQIIAKKGHNPYFNRWFSAIRLNICSCTSDKSHNPYFNRWFSAISKL